MSKDVESVPAGECEPSDGLARRAGLERRRDRALSLWLRGVTFRDIGRRLGIPKSTAERDVHAAIESVEFKREDERKRDVMRLERMTQALWKRATGSKGKPADDFAVDRIAGKLLPLKARLLGTLAPVQIESSGLDVVLRVNGTEVTPMPPPAPTDTATGDPPPASDAAADDGEKEE